MKNITQNKGFTVLYAVLTTSLLLSISLGIYSLSLLDYKLSSAASESQKAVYAADSGAECALYLDRRFTDFFRRSETLLGSSGLEYCGESEVDAASISSHATFSIDQFFPAATSTFTIWFTTDEIDGPCAEIAVGKALLAGSDHGNPYYNTFIDSRGYNTCNEANPRRVERGLQVYY